MEKQARREKTKEEILQAACHVFIEKGYQGASISDIARVKGLNQSLIYHYFEDKKELWHRAKEYLLKEYIEGSAACIDTERGLKNFLMKFCRYGFEYLASHPGVMRILTWQRLEDSRSRLVDFNLTGRQGFEKAFVEMQKKHEIKADLDPHLTTVLIRSFVRAPFFDDFSEIEDRKQRYLETIVSCFEKMLQP
jgi:AcrR family transcriptional regulator